MVTAWDDKVFCARVVRRCEELGRSRRAVLKEAGLTHDYLHTAPRHGRRIDGVARLAEVLDLPVEILLGLPPPMIDTHIMLIAFRASQPVKVLGDAIFLSVLAGVYDELKTSLT